MASSALQSNEGRQNFQRLTRLLIAGATTIVRETFDTIHPPVTLATVLADPARQAILGRAKMTRLQRKQVYPSPGAYGKSKDWDLTLLHKMLRNICGMTQPATGWDDLPPDSDISKEADLVRLKYYRNSIYGHVDERMRIEDEEYQKLWRNISEAIKRLAGRVSSAKKKEWEDAIEDFSTAPLTTDDMRNIEELRSWYRQDVEMREELATLKGDVKEELTTLKGDVKEELTTLKGDLKEELTTLKGDVKQEITTWKGDMRELMIGEISPTKQRSQDPTTDTCTEPYHEDQLVEWFCEACREFVCQTCVALHHTTHPCVNMNDPAHMQTVTQKLLDSSEKMRCEIQKHKTQIREIESNGALRNEKLNKLKDEIKDTVNKLIEKLREQEAKLQRDIESTQKIYQENDASQVSEIEEHVRKMETWVRYTEKLANDGSAVNKVTNKEQTLRCREQLIASDRKIEPKTIAEYLFTPNENLSREIKDVGTVYLWDCVAEGEGLKKGMLNARSAFTIRTIPVHCTQDQTICSPNTLNVKISSPQGSVDPAIQHNNDGTYTVSYVPTHPGDHDISVTIDGEDIPGCPHIATVSQCVTKGEGLTKLVVGLRSQFMISIRGPNGENVNDPTTKLNVKIQSPQGAIIPAIRIQSNKDGTYLVSFFPVRSGEHQVFVYVRDEVPESECQEEEKLNGREIPGSPFIVVVKPREFRSVLSFGKKGKGKGEFDHPTAVTVNNKDQIIVADYNNHRLQVFSSKGEHLRTIGAGRSDFNYPYGVASDENNNLFVVDQNCRVQMFTETGEFIRSFGSEERSNRKLVYPAELSMDTDGNIIVTDWGDGRVKLFSRNGLWLKSFDCGDRPYRCIAHDDRYYVSSPSNYCIKVFDKSGTFLCEYDARGSSPGEFIRPSGLAVDKAGNLIVCHSWNGKLQVLQMDGTFVGSFSVKEEGLGQLRFPSSVAVIEDGKIVVSDKFNHRIQVFE